MTIEFIDNTNRFFQDVKALGKKNSATLGFMPEGGFEDHARNKCIIIAHDGKVLAGYLMYRIVSRFSRISIVHLCVNDDYRGKCVSVALLNALKEKYEKTLKGISISCRTDYEHASSLWRNYGFSPIGRVRSRSFEENYLNRWWYDFHQADLFSDTSSSKVKALLDMNIIVKLRDAERGEGLKPDEDPRGLMADWLVDETELCFAPEAYNEIDRDENHQRATQTRMFLSSFTQLDVDVAEQKKIVKDLEDVICGKTENDISDRKQVASCIVSQTPYFITYDDGLLNKREEIEKRYPIQLYNPQEFIIQIDRLLHGKDYLPNQLEGVSSDSLSKLSPQEMSYCIDKFWQQKEGEEKQHFGVLVSDLINKQGGKLFVMKRNGETIAFYGIYEHQESIDIELLRISEKDTCNSLFFQIISEILKKNLSSNKPKIFFKEKYISEEQKETLVRFGFILQDNCFVKFVFNGIIAKEDVSGVIHQSYPSIAIEHNDSILFEVEKTLFPLKIKGLNIPSYIIPIKQYWAGQLFDMSIANEDLFGANPEKLWSFENVYYRHTKPITERYPARILWYVSGNGKSFSHAKSIVASSYLVDVMTGKPKTLYRVNKRYGIYEWEHIYELCEGDVDTDIRALKFCHTELFKYPVCFEKIQEILISNGRKKNTFTSPIVIDETIYFQIYQLGKWRGQQ